MAGKKILIADDDMQLLRAMTVRLKAHGHEVYLARDGYQAMQYATMQRPDVLILDVNMPAGDAFSVMDRLRSIPDLGMMPLVFITGEKSDRIDALIEQFGPQAVLYKPFDADELISAIDLATNGTTESAA